MGGKRWTENECSIIREHYPEWGAVKCAELIPNRAYASIKKKAEDLGIRANITNQRRNLGIKKSDLPKYHFIHETGYLKFSPNFSRDNYVYYHRFVMEKHLGRKLSSDEIVHHKDGNKLNNDIANLEIMSRAEHARHHHKKHLNTEAEAI